jgi:hypothetical protein
MDKCRYPSLGLKWGKAMQGGWEISTSMLPGYIPLPEGWSGDDSHLFEIPDSPLAYIVYNIEEVGLAKFAGKVAVFRDSSQPSRIFAPDRWFVWPMRGVIRCNQKTDLLLVYIANAYDPLEVHALVDLVAQQFAPVLIPFPVANYTFTQIGDCRFAMIPEGGDEPPYPRSYLIEPTDLRWFPYTVTNGVAHVGEPSRQNPSVWHQHEMAWQIVWHRVYALAFTGETPNDAKRITDRVMTGITMSNLNDVLDRTDPYHSKPDDRRLYLLIAEARGDIRREREEGT